MNKETNKQILVDYFQAGAKGAQLAGYVGVEVEHFVVESETLAPVPYEPKDGKIGVRDILEYLSAYYPERSYNLKNELIALAGPDGSITIEPAAQLEISMTTFTTVEEVQDAYARFRGWLDPYLEKHGLKLENVGYHPTTKALDLELIPKVRYRYMNEHFTEIGSHGHRMMRASASLQVSVDYSDEADAVQKMRVASALVPILSLITDNVKFFEGEEIPYSLARLRLWRDVDNDRCGVIPSIFDDGFGFEAYAEWLLATSPIFVDRPAADDPTGPRLRRTGTATAAEAYNDAPLAASDVEHLISMFWPDVRLKHFVEIRPADCLPAPLICGYTALIKGLFYSQDALDQLAAELGAQGTHWTLTTDDVEAAIQSLAQDGLKGTAYGTAARTWIQRLFALAAEGLPENEHRFLEPLHAFALQKHQN